MEFDLLKFTLAPTTEKQWKKDLLLIADFFNVNVSREAAKQVIKEELYFELMNTGILPTESPLEVAEQIVTVGETSVSGLPFSTESFLDPLTAINLKELDFELKKQDHAIKALQLRTIEVEAQRDIKLKSLELEAEALHRKPVPLPRLRAPSSPAFRGAQSHSSTVNYDPLSNTQPNFDVAKYVKLVPFSF